jgi:hypothetical protein
VDGELWTAETRPAVRSWKPAMMMLEGHAACAFNKFVELELVPYTTIMAPKFLTGDKAGIEEFLNKFDVSLNA